jgi:diguanylate cyclase (GGDEF)-like protein
MLRRYPSAVTSSAPPTREAGRRPAYADGAFSERTPYLVLGAIFVVGGILDFVFDLTVVDDPMLHSTDLVSGVVLLCAGVLLAWLGPRAASGWPLDLALGFGYVLAIAGATRLNDDVGMVTLGFSLGMYGVFSAVFRPPAPLVAHLAIMMGLYAVVAVSRSDLDLEVVAYICVFVVCVSLLVAVMAGKLRRMALHDGLTGTLNRHGLDVMSELVAANAARTDAPVALCLVDLDRFGDYNDRAGHVAGDARLVDVARAWQSHVRATDLLARWGGDEFAVVLPGATLDDVVELADRVQASAAVPFSVGITLWLPAEDLYVALRRAHASLREATSTPEP